MRKRIRSVITNITQNLFRRGKFTLQTIPQRVKPFCSCHFESLQLDGSQAPQMRRKRAGFEKSMNSITNLNISQNPSAQNLSRGAAFSFCYGSSRGGEKSGFFSNSQKTINRFQTEFINIFIRYFSL